jgi:putative serine protease PepD
VERSEWSDDEPFAFRQPLPPEDRVWRHPSELGAGVGSGFVASSRRATVSRGKLAVAVVVSATGALLVAGLVSVALRTGGSGRAAVIESSATSFGFAATTLPVMTGAGRPPDGVVHLVVATDSGDRYSSGVVLDDRGTIVTTSAAVDGAHRILALLADGTQQEAALLGVDDDAGAAVLRVTGRPLSADSGWAITLAPGARVHTVGGGGSTATVANLGANAVNDAGHKVSHLVKLDVAAGDKAKWAAEGAPLLDAQERVVGLCTSDSDGDIYAVPIEIPRAAARSIDVHGRVVVPWLGLSGHDEPGENGGAVVQSVADKSPAQAAGLAASDVVVAIDGEPVTSMATLALGLRAYDAGAMIDLTYLRDSTVRHAFPTLAEHT